LLLPVYLLLKKGHVRNRTSFFHGRDPMLVLSRRIGEEIIINGNIRVTVVASKGDRVRLGIVAPRDVTVDRSEVHDRRHEFAPVMAGADADAAIGVLASHSIDDTIRH
jgi:carbon storage regulator